MNLLSARIEPLLERGRLLLESLALPSREEYLLAASSAFHDARTASLSSWNLAYLTFRPVFILFGIISKYLATILQVILQHSLAHGFVAAREGYFQLRTATIWFVRFQHDLPLTAKYAEMGAVIALLILWLLRRRFQKYRYGERAFKWYRSKKERAVKCYEGVVNKVAETSLLLAMLLPHLLYILVIAAMKRFFPSILTYLATRTYLISAISIWNPLYQTIRVIGRVNHILSSLASQDDHKESTIKSNSSLAPSKVKQQQKHKEQLEEHTKNAIDLLKYWVVYAILNAIFRTAKLIPFIRSILPINESSQSTTRGLFGSKVVKPGFLTRLRLSGKLVEEIRLVFFIWLLLMPVSFSRADNNSESPKTKQKTKSNMPVDILYNTLSPFIISTMKSSAFLSNRVEGSSFGAKAIRFMRSLLDFLVMTRALSENTRDFIMQTIVESSALLPAAVTMFTPSYFTCYGVIYVGLVVPSGYSIEQCNAVAKSTSSLKTIMCKIQDISRYLQFWVVSAFISTILWWFEPILAWVPLSTHAIWLLWSFVQMNYPTRKLYSLIEEELIVFGLLESYGKDPDIKTLDDTILFRSAKRIIAALPSNTETNETTKTTEVNETIQKKQQ
ncbi:hypothetical protein HJC23_010983 [Cyclotella cryptica]|uniref:Uncharacterized protein n=1 Tax=Cyclotella cryptica TaxID=29204 RepID=A0ABD3PY07_9STRA|eukprot:CCRYP_010281-RA/>CCRYP_010281-RA protein AED:0.27 eAED:0.27 QI:136/1/1/1/0/0/2/105/615